MSVYAAVPRLRYVRGEISLVVMKDEWNSQGLVLPKAKREEPVRLLTQQCMDSNISLQPGLYNQPGCDEILLATVVGDSCILEYREN